MGKEEKKLDGIYLGRLTHPEFSQCIDRQVTEIQAQGNEVLTDVTINELLAELAANGLEFHNAILRIKKSPYTDLLKTLDAVRDRALMNYDHALRQFNYSEDSEEFKAFHKLTILSTTFKGIAKLNYEAETKEMKKFLANLET